MEKDLDSGPYGYGKIWALGIGIEGHLAVMVGAAKRVAQRFGIAFDDDAIRFSVLGFDATFVCDWVDSGVVPDGFAALTKAAAMAPEAEALIARYEEYVYPERRTSDGPPEAQRRADIERLVVIKEQLSDCVGRWTRANPPSAPQIPHDWVYGDCDNCGMATGRYPRIDSSGIWGMVCRPCDMNSDDVMLSFA
jgi:hypothetical protein